MLGSLDVELTDRFGQLPDPVHNLLYGLRVKGGRGASNGRFPLKIIKICYLNVIYRK